MTTVSPSKILFLCDLTHGFPCSLGCECCCGFPATYILQTLASQTPSITNVGKALFSLIY